MAVGEGWWIGRFRARVSVPRGMGRGWRRFRTRAWGSQENGSGRPRDWSSETKRKGQGPGIEEKTREREVEDYWMGTGRKMEEIRNEPNCWQCTLDCQRARLKMSQICGARMKIPSPEWFVCCRECSTCKQKLKASDERIDFNYLSQLLVAPVNCPWNEMINVEPLIGNEKINQPRTTENHSLFHDLLSSMELRMLVGDPGFPKRWGAPTLNRERQPIIWPKFSRKLQENETNGTGGGRGGWCTYLMSVAKTLLN